MRNKAQVPNLGLECAIALLSLLALSVSTSAECRLHLDLNTNGTGLQFSGVSVASLMPGSGFPVNLRDAENTRIGLSGPMYMHLPSTRDCPQTQTDWIAAAKSLRITSAPSPYHYKPLNFYPESLQLEVMGVPLNISNLALNMSLTGNSASGAANPVKLDVNASIADGYVFSDTILTGGPQLQQLIGPPSISSSNAVISVTKQGGSNVLSIALTNLNLTFTGKTSGMSASGPWSGSMTVSFTGPIQLSGILGCPKDCGDFGRCIAASTNSSTTAANSSSQFVCECQCGWKVDPKTGRCEIPAGTCPVYESERSSRSALAGANSSDSCPQGGDASAVMAANGVCPNSYGFDVMTKACKRCEEDWTGTGCNQCTTDNACRVRTGKSNAVCSTGLLYNERSSQKEYQCQLSDPSIARIIGPWLPITCKTSGGDQPASGSTSIMAVSDSNLLGSTSTCAIAMRLAGMPAGQSAICQATGCHFTAGQPSFRCDGVACDCPKGCPAAYLNTFRGISGAVTLDCDSTGQDCTVVVGSLNMKIKGSCEASECLDPSGPKLVGSTVFKEGGPPIAPPLVAALPALLLVLAGLACSIALVKYWPYLRSSKKYLADWAAANSNIPRPSYASGAVADGAAAFGAAAAAGAIGKSKLGGTGSAPGTPKASAAAGASGFLAAGSMQKGIGQITQLTFADITAEVKLARGWKDSLKRMATPLLQQQRRLAAAPAAATASKNSNDNNNHNTSRVVGLVTLSQPGNDVEKGVERMTLHAAAPTAACDTDSRGSSTGGSSTSGTAGSSSWRPVLCGVSGSVASGEVLGIMGPSGCGKSTLLLKLCGSLGGAGRGANWRSGGIVCLDGVVAPPSLLSAVTALVPQDDSLIRSLTVEECIRYSAALRLDPDLPAVAVKSRVESVLSTLGLTHIRSNTVLSGTGVSGVSGGERRRVAIGMELVIDPQILVLDEPLSGLDSYTALQLMKTLQQVASSGRVVALSLHQPTPAIYGSLDTAMLLAAGLLVYAGPPAAAESALERLGWRVPEGITLAEHMLNVVNDPESLQSVVAAAQAQQQQHKREALQQQQLMHQQPHHTRTISSDSGNGDQQQQSGAPPAPAALKAALQSAVGGHSTPRSSYNGSGAVNNKPWYLKGAGTFSPRPSASGQARVALGLPAQKRPLSRQIGVLFWRGMLDMLRNPLLTAFHSVGGLVLGLLVGIIFFQVKNDTSGAQNRVGAIFFALCLLAFTSVTGIDLIQAERAAAGREMQRKYYSPFAYAVTKLVLDGLLLRALPAVLFALPFYFLMGLAPVALQFFVFLLVLIGFSAAVGALALGFASSLDSPGKTILVMNLVLLLGVLFGGFLANKASIPVWLRWISYLSMFRYSWEALVVNELSGIDLFLSAPGVALSLPVRGEVFLEIIGVQTSLFIVDIAVLVAIYVAACVFLIFVVSWRNRQHKH